MEGKRFVVYHVLQCQSGESMKIPAVVADTPESAETAAQKMAEGLDKIPPVFRQLLAKLGIHNVGIMITAVSTPDGEKRIIAPSAGLAVPLNGAKV